MKNFTLRSSSGNPQHVALVNNTGNCEAFKAIGWKHFQRGGYDQCLLEAGGAHLIKVSVVCALDSEWEEAHKNVHRKWEVIVDNEYDPKFKIKMEWTWREGYKGYCSVWSGYMGIPTSYEMSFKWKGSVSPKKAACLMVEIVLNSCLEKFNEMVDK